MRQLTATADQIVYLIRRHIVPRPPESDVNPARDTRVALMAIGQLLKDEYKALATPVPLHVAALVRELETQK
jgi:hypothetical protein